jgi:hypothetical protein
MSSWLSKYSQDNPAGQPETPGDAFDNSRVFRKIGLAVSPACIGHETCLSESPKRRKRECMGGFSKRVRSRNVVSRGEKKMRMSTDKMATLLVLVLPMAGLSVAHAQSAPAQAAPAQPAPAAAAVPKPAALGMYVYPGSGQNAAQQDKDEVECYKWARQQTNIDPMAAPSPVQAAEVPKGGAVKGAAKGAAAGAVIGEAHDGDASSGAGTGAAVGAMKGRRAQKKAEKKAEQQAQQQGQAAAATTKDTFNKAWGACLEGRKYSVK